MPRFFLALLVSLNVSLFYAQVQIDTIIDLSSVKKVSIGKKVMIDGAHHNLHRINSGFSPTAILLKHMGFDVTGNDRKFNSLENLQGIDILVIANPLSHLNRGRPVNPIFSAFEPQEIKCIENWVTQGGSLLLIADHMPFAGAADSLARSFGIKYENGFVDGQTDRWPPHTFRRKDLTIRTEIFSKKQIDSVASFTGSALKLPVYGEPVLIFTAADTIIYPDTAWVFTPGLKRNSLEGYVQGGIVHHGKGKVAAFGEAAMFTAQKIMPEGLKAGFNSEWAGQNIEFIQELMRYLVGR